MFRFAYTKMNNGSCTAAADRAEAASSCAAANTAEMKSILVMDAAVAASILICLSVLGLRVLGLSILGIIICYCFKALGRTQA